MEDKGVDFTKPPPEPEYPQVNRSVPRCFLLRESGFKQNTNTPPTELQWAAEDNMVIRQHEEFRCHLPDVSRSTFLMVFSPDGKKVASTHGNHNVYVTDLTSGKNIKTLSGHPRTPWCIAFHPSSNQILATGCLGGQVRVWDLSGGSEIWMAENQTVITSLAFHPIDRMLVIASYNELHFWDWSQPEPFAKCFTANEREKVRYVAFDSLGHKLITGVANAPTRHHSQWDRVAAPQPSPQASQLESERRITICYRYMVEQYEQLVQRYRDLTTRTRSTLTMDRGTDPMEFEGESSDSQNTTQCAPPDVVRPGSPTRHSFTGPCQRVGVASGTDEASASHSSTNFLTPPEPDPNEDNSVSSTQPLLGVDEEENDEAEVSSSTMDMPRRNLRFDITLPSFSSFRTRSSSVSSLEPTRVNEPTFFTRCTNNNNNSEVTGFSRIRPLSRLSLSPDTIGFGWDQSNTPGNTSGSQNTHNQPGQNPSETSHRCESSSSAQQMVRNLVTSLFTRSDPSEGTSTEVNSAVESENEEPSFQGFHSESQTDEEEGQPRPIVYSTLPSLNRGARSARNSGVVDSENEETDSIQGVQEQGNQGEVETPAAAPPLGGSSGNPLPSSSSAARTSRNSEGSARRFSETSAVSQLRSQFHRLQSVYENRNYASNAHVFSPESQACERRLLNRINEILSRPIPEPRPRRLFASRRSAFQSRPQPSNTAPSTSTNSATAAPPDVIGGVRYGIQQLSRHIDNMQRLCRARLEILQLQQIRRMWEDLQSQIFALHGEVREAGVEEGGGNLPPTADQPAEGPSNISDLLTDDDSDGPSSNGELHWRMRRTPQTSRRNVKTSQPRTPNRNPPMKRSRLTLRPNDYNRRLSMLQMETSRRQLNRQASSSTQATSEERGEASSSQVSGETSTGTSDERASVRGLKRKSRDSDPLFRPRPSSSGQGQSTTLTCGNCGSSGTSGTLGNSGSTGNSVNNSNSGTSGSSATSGVIGTGNIETTGNSGTTARSGTSGKSGTSNNSGTSVTSGTTGSSELTGNRGTSINSGTTGNSRTRGISGTTGNSGTPGNNETAGNSGTSGDNNTPTSLVAVMRATIVQLENMVWRHRPSTAQRTTRLTRFTRQREERMLRNLWDTESSHESSRDDQSEGDSSQQSEAGGIEEEDDDDPADTEWTRDATRVRARQVLLLMVDSLTQFFENDNLIRRTSSEALNDRINNLYVLLQLALNLTDLLLAQLVQSRRELEARRPSMLESPSWSPSRHGFRAVRHSRHSVARNVGRTSLAWRRILRRAAPATSPSTSPPPTQSTTSPEPSRRPPPGYNNGLPHPPPVPNRGYPLHRPHSIYHNLRSAMLSHAHSLNRPLCPVPIVRVNDLPPPPPEVNSSRFRPHSPPPLGPNPMFVPPRFLHPARYTGGSLLFDESTSEDSSPQDRSNDFFFMRAGYGSSSVILTETPMSPQHRIQAWDFSKYKLPDLGNADKNIVVGECKIHNDASVDMSKDDRMLVTLLPSGRLTMTTLLGIYSLQWDTLGQLLYTTSFEQSIVSVSLSPTSRHLVVGLASRRVTLVNADRHINAQVFRLEGASPGRKAPLGSRGRLVHLRDLELSRHLGFMSLNCIRWAPNPGQGLVYGTNTGHLKILR